MYFNNVKKIIDVVEVCLQSLPPVLEKNESPQLVFNMTPA
jgi:hypothetical protein